MWYIQLKITHSIIQIPNSSNRKKKHRSQVAALGFYSDVEAPPMHQLQGSMMMSPTDVQGIQESRQENTGTLGRGASKQTSSFVEAAVLKNGNKVVAENEHSQW